MMEHRTLSRTVLPSILLLILSPGIVEVLFGATRISMLYLLVPQICIYGGAALMIRTVSRQRRLGWSAILLLGLAFAVLEECVILQTSVSPVYVASASHNYSWAFGVNWLYLVWALVDEAVWGILLPIQLVELMYPAQRTQSWLNRRMLIVTAAIFLIASVGIWYRFTQVGIVPGQAFEAPLPLVALALVVVIGLCVLAFGSRLLVRARVPSKRWVPRPWLAGIIAFVLALPWFALPIVPYVVDPSFPAFVPIGIGVVWAIGAFALVARWANSIDWRDSHRLALISGALTASMLAGYVVNAALMTPLDLVGKLVLNVAALIVLAMLRRRIRRPERGGIVDTGTMTAHRTARSV